MYAHPEIGLNMFQVSNQPSEICLAVVQRLHKVCRQSYSTTDQKLYTAMSNPRKKIYNETAAPVFQCGNELNSCGVESMVHYHFTARCYCM